MGVEVEPHFCLELAVVLSHSSISIENSNGVLPVSFRGPVFILAAHTQMFGQADDLPGNGVLGLDVD